MNVIFNWLLNRIVSIYLFIYRRRGENKNNLCIKIKTNKNLLMFWKVVNWMMFKFKLIGNFSLCCVNGFRSLFSSLFLKVCSFRWRTDYRECPFLLRPELRLTCKCLLWQPSYHLKSQFCRCRIRRTHAYTHTLCRNTPEYRHSIQMYSRKRMRMAVLYTQRHRASVGVSMRTRAHVCVYMYAWSVLSSTQSFQYTISMIVSFRTRCGEVRWCVRLLLYTAT